MSQGHSRLSADDQLVYLIGTTSVPISVVIISYIFQEI